MKFPQFKLPLLLVLQNNSVNLDVKSTGMEIKWHQNFLHVQLDLLLIDKGEGLKVNGEKEKNPAALLRAVCENAVWGRARGLGDGRGPSGCRDWGGPCRVHEMRR